MQTSQILNKQPTLKHIISPLVLVGLILLTMLLLPQPARANAGMVVTTKDGGKTYLLLVQTHKQHYYEFPGGRVERGEDLIHKGRQKETFYEAAVRETMEETRGYIGRQQLLSASSKEQFIELGKYRFFSAKLPFFELNAVRAIKIPKGKKWDTMREVVNYVWVDVELARKGGRVVARDGKKITLHPITKNVMKAGRGKQWF